MKRRFGRLMALACASMIATIAAIAAASAEPAPQQIKVGVLKVGATGPVYVAVDRGYFAAAGLEAELVYFGAGSAVAEAVVAGSVDIGVTGLTAGLYNMAAGGQVRVISGLHREAPSFHELGYFASPRAWAAGWRSFKDFPGHSVAITTIGSTTHYALGLLAEHEGFSLSSVQPLPLQSIPNSASAVVGNKADFALLPGTFLEQLKTQDVHLVGWVGDVTPWQIGSVFTATKTADTRHDMLKHFLAALQKGVHDYYDAFTAPNGAREDGPTAPAILAIISDHLDQPAERLEHEVPYVDPTMRIDLADIDHQIAWYRAHGMIKAPLTGKQVVDLRYAPLMHPE